MNKIKFTDEESETLKEYSRVCLAISELKEKLSILNQAKKMFETTGTKEMALTVFQILDSKVRVGEGVLVKGLGVELVNVMKKQTIPLSKLEIQKRLTGLLNEEEAVAVYSKLTDKRYRNHKDVNKIQCNVVRS